MLIGYYSAFLAGLEVRRAIDVAVEAGLDAIELNGDAWGGPRPHLTPHLRKEERREIKQALDATGLRLSAVSASVHLARRDPTDRRAATSHVETLMDQAAELGSPLIWCFSGRALDDLKRDDALGIVIDALGRLTERARAVGLDFAVEGCAPHIIRSVAEYEHLFATLGASAPAVAFDPGHFATHGEDPVEAAVALGPRTKNLHVKDLSGKPPDMRTVRLGSGVIDLCGVLDALGQAGFCGVASIENDLAPSDEGDAKRMMEEDASYLRGLDPIGEWE
jgi:sugar phosphate isomerase/epimerase